jgi:ABC-type sugar transport system ATPase subunit
VAILFITHRLEELLALADEITVIRDGETVAAASGDVSRAAILSAMTRADDGGEGRVEVPPRRAPEHRPEGAPVLRARGVRIRGGQPIDFELGGGEIVGLAGLEGHGQERFLQALAGVEPPDGGTVVRVGDSGESAIRSLHTAAANGIVYLPRDRARAGIFPALSVLDNFALPTMSRSTRWGLLKTRSLAQRLEAMREALHIRMPSGRAPITNLSGGNQQKLLIARWLAADPAVMLLDDPTRGVDLPTKAELHALLRRQLETGMAVVMVSTELEELEGVCDRVLVFHEGSLAATLEGADVGRDAVLAAMFGGNA